jgi:hypothetical protein
VGPILAVYAVSRLVLLGVVVDVYGPHRAVVGLARIWDGIYYLQIAQHGYPTALTHNVSSVVAFFPLYPLLVRLVMAALGDMAVAATAVSLLTGASACLAVGALARRRAGTEAGVRAGWLVALAPGAAFLSTAYAEGLAISLCALAILMLDERRWVAAGAWGALATLTSPLALPVVVTAAWAAYRSRRRAAWVAAGLSASGFASYCVFLWVHVGTPWAWFDAERTGWGQHHVDLFAPLHWLATGSGATLVDTFGIAAAVGGFWVMRRSRVPVTWWVFTVAFLASVVFDSALWLTPRFLLSAFPFTAALGIVVEGRRFRMLATASAALMVVVLVAYTSFPGFVYRP